MRSDVRVDPQAHRSHLPALRRHRLNHLQLCLGLHIEPADALLKAQPDLPVRFAYSRVNYVPRLESRIKGLVYFSTTDAVGTEPRGSYQPQYLRVGIGLDGIMDLPRRILQFLFNYIKSLLQKMYVVVVERGS